MSESQTVVLTGKLAVDVQALMEAEINEDKEQR